MSPGDTNTRKPAKGKNPSHRPASTARPACLRITKAKREKYLEAIAAGISSSEAAREVGHTGRLFRSLRRNDPAFAAAFDQAYEQAARFRIGDLREALWNEGVVERNPRILVWLGNTLLPEAAYKRVHHSHVEMTGEVTHVIDPDALEQLRGELATVVDLEPRRLALAPGKPQPS